MAKSRATNPITARFLSILFISVFIIVGIPVGILISRSQQIIKDNSTASEETAGPTIYQEETTVDFMGCKTTCIDECKRADNCPGTGNLIGHCGWTRTKPVVEKKWCRQCTRSCPTIEPTGEI